MRIAEIREWELFQNLVRALYVADRGNAFQLVDDAGGDGGLDGYDNERKVLYAVYCPRKPANDRTYLEKALRDLAKAVRLRDEGRYPIETFAFVTPQHVREPVVRTLREEAQAAGLDAVSIGTTHLEDLFLRHPHVRERFPQLSYPEIQQAIQDLTSEINRLSEAQAGPSPSPSGDSPGAEARLFSGIAFPRLYALQERIFSGDPEAVEELEQLRLESSVPEERLAAVLLATRVAGDQLDFARVRDLAASGLALAEALEHEPALAVLQAEKARALTMDLVRLDLDTAAQISMGNRIGFHLVTTEDQQRLERKMEAMISESESLFSAAFENAWERPNLEASFMVLLLYASSMAQRMFPFEYLKRVGELGPHSETPELLKHRVERAYEVAIRIATVLEDDRFLSMAYSNFANDLRIFGEAGRAKSHAKRALELANELDDPDLKWRPEKLLAGLEDAE